MQDFIQAIADEHVYLFDGAMGTMLYSKGVFINRCYDELNLRNPEIVLEVHKQYVRAGAEVLETNTYGANRVKLRGFGIEDELRDVNLAAVEIARKAAGDSVYVGGAIGPLGIRIEPYGPTALEEAREIFREQAAALRDAGVDLFILETFSNIAEIEQGILAIRDICSIPIVAQMTIGNDGRTSFGDMPSARSRRAAHSSSSTAMRTAGSIRASSRARSPRAPTGERRSPPASSSPPSRSSLPRDRIPRRWWRPCAPSRPPASTPSTSPTVRGRRTAWAPS